MRVTVNGRAEQLPDGTTLAELLEHLGHGGTPVALALNQEFVPRSRYGTTAVREGDEVEIVAPQAGG